MKLTFKLGKYDKGGRHNDRNYDYTDDNHIDNERVKDNIYRNYVGREGETFKESEKRFYEEHFGEILKERNQRLKNDGHRKRAKTMEQYMTASHSRIEDGWFQIGDKNNHIDGETLWKVFEDWKERQDELYGSKCIFLNASLHMDEATPHIQFRRVWLTENEKGEPVISKSRCLSELGFGTPDKEHGSSRVNNSNTLFTASERELLRNIAKEHGIELEPMGKKREWVPMNQYKEQKAEEHLRSLEQDIGERTRTLGTVNKELSDKKQELSEVGSSFDELNDIAHEYELMMLANEQFARDRNLSEEKFKEMSLKEKARLAGEYLRAAMDAEKYNTPMADVETLPFREDYYDAEDFIKAKGLSDEFEQFRKTREAEREGIEPEKADPEELPDWAKD